MKYLVLLILFAFGITALFGQTYTLQGTVQGEEDQSTFPGATVILKNLPDSTSAYGVTTDFNGHFTMPDVRAGKYLFEVSFIGYAPVVKTIQVNENINFGNINMKEGTTTLSEIEIVAETLVGTQSGDTTEFSSKSFQTTKDASAQDLVTKMPGIAVVDGQIQAQGEAVQTILVDGKPFFEGDVQSALQNLPSEVIAAIQVYDKKSDKAELSGFDDGERTKTINIVTKPDRRKGQFGKTSAGYGTDSRYQLGASVNLFNNDQRITLTGLSNNINMVNYTADPNSQGESRTQNGIINTNNLGINFSDEWDKLEIAGSYYFSHRDNEGSARLDRTYILPSDSGQVYSESSSNNRTNMDHNLNARVDYKLDENNSFRWRPNISLRHDKNNDEFEGRTENDEGLLNQTTNNSNSRNQDYDFDSRLFYSHKFNKEGRSLTIRQEAGYHTNDDESARLARNIYYNREDSLERLDQTSGRDRKAVNWGFQTSYTEPLGDFSMMELEYEITNKVNDSDQLTYDNEEPEYVLDTALSNTFESGYFTQQTELGYQYNKDKVRMQVEVEYQSAKLKNSQGFPAPFEMERNFNSILPSVRVDYNLTETKRLELDYFTHTNEPSIGQLQAVIDNSNPLQLKTGNPELGQTYNHWVRARYRESSKKGKTVYASVESSFIKDYVTNATTIAEETQEVTDDVILEEGSQLIKPENADGYYRFKTYFHYGKPVDYIKSNLNIRGMVNYDRRPGIINSQASFVKSTDLMLGLSLSSNISEKVDFNFSTRGVYHIINNSLRPALDNEYYNQSTHLRSTWIFGNEFVWRTDVNHRLNTGLAKGYDRSYMILNMSVGKKFLKDDLGELSLNVFDLLDENNNVGRTVTDTYIQDRESAVLNRYLMLTFTYNIRHFSKGTTIDDFKDI